MIFKFRFYFDAFTSTRTYGNLNYSDQTRQPSRPGSAARDYDESLDASKFDGSKLDELDDFVIIDDEIDEDYFVIVNEASI